MPKWSVEKNSKGFWWLMVLIIPCFTYSPVSLLYWTENQNQAQYSRCDHKYQIWRNRHFFWFAYYAFLLVHPTMQFAFFPSRLYCWLTDVKLMTLGPPLFFFCETCFYPANSRQYSWMQIIYWRCRTSSFRLSNFMSFYQPSSLVCQNTAKRHSCYFSLYFLNLVPTDLLRLYFTLSSVYTFSNWWRR